MFGKEQNSIRTERVTTIKVCGAIQNIVFGTVLLSLRLLFRRIPEKAGQAETRVRAENYHSNFVLCRTMRNDMS